MFKNCVTQIIAILCIYIYGIQITFLNQIVWLLIEFRFSNILYLNSLQNHACSNIISNGRIYVSISLIMRFMIICSSSFSFLFPWWHNIHLICIVSIKTKGLGITSCSPYTLKYFTYFSKFYWHEMNWEID